MVSETAKQGIVYREDTDTNGINGDQDSMYSKSSRRIVIPDY